MELNLIEGLSHIPTLAPNGLIDTLRIITAISSGLLISPMLMVAYRTKNYGFYTLSIFMFLSAVGEADQVGRPFIVYQLPLRILGVLIAAYWLWKRRDNSRA